MSIFTQADLDKAKAAYIDILSRGAVEIEINGRSIKYHNPEKLLKLIKQMELEINSGDQGGYINVRFKDV